MAEFEPISLSILPLSKIAARDDLLIVDVLDRADIETQIVRLQGFIDLFTSLDLNFSGDVTFVGTIQPSPTETLDGIFDNFVVRDVVDFKETDVSGFLLTHCEDVTITERNQYDDILLYGINSNTRLGEFTNIPIDSGVFLSDPPEDGGVYAKTIFGWQDISACIRCDGTIEIGDVTINKITEGRIKPGAPVVFRAEFTGNPDDPEYEWAIIPDSVNILSIDQNNILVEFQEGREYNVGVKVTDFFSIDSPQHAVYLAFVESEISSVTIAAETDVVYVGQEVEYTANVSTTAASLNYEWRVSPKSASIRITGENKATIRFDSAVDYVVSCTVSSPTSQDKPTAYYNVNVRKLLGDVYIIKQTTGTPLPSDPVSFTGVYTGDATSVNYLWTTYPTTSSITGKNSKDSTIVFDEGGLYNVRCVFSSTTDDSPKEAVYQLNVNETFRILTNPNSRFITTTRSNNHLNYQYKEFLGDVSIEKNTEGPVIKGTPTSFSALYSGFANNVTYLWTTEPSTLPISGRYSKNATITFNERGTYKVSCQISSSSAEDSPKTAIYFVNSGEYLGDCTVSLVTEGDIQASREVIFSADFSGNAQSVQYQWSTIPTSSTISGGNTNLAKIVFDKGGYYYVRCTMSSATASDSPKEPYYALSVSGAFRLLQDDNSDAIYTESNDILMYDD